MDELINKHYIYVSIIYSTGAALLHSFNNFFAMLLYERIVIGRNFLDSCKIGVIMFSTY